MERSAKEIKQALFDQSKKIDSTYFNLMDIAESTGDSVLVRLIEKYRNIHTVNRNMREALQFVENAIHHREERSTQIPKFEGEDLLFARASDNLSFILEVGYIKAGIIYAFIVYSRWFLSTEGKTRLNPKDFFAKGSKEEQWHDNIVKIRSKYIAHNELDLFSEDVPYIEKEKDGSWNICAKYYENIGMEQSDIFRLEQLRNCICIVHDINLKRIGELDEKIRESIIRLGVVF